MIGLSYVCSVLLPFVGFFMGLYLVLKREHGHGLACIALSIVCGVIAVMIVASF